MRDGALAELIAALDELDRIARGHVPGFPPPDALRVELLEVIAPELLAAAVRRLEAVRGSDAPGGCRSAGRARPAGRRRHIRRGQPHRLGAWDHRAGGVAADAGGRRGRARPDRADHRRRVRAIARLVARCRGRPGGSRGAVGPVPGHGRGRCAVRRERRRDPRRALRPRRRADRWRVRRPAARAPRRVRRAVDRGPPAVPPGGDHAARSRRRGRSDARGGPDRDRPVGRCRCRRARRAGRRGLRRRGRVLRRGR